MTPRWLQIAQAGSIWLNLAQAGSTLAQPGSTWLKLAHSGACVQPRIGQPTQGTRVRLELAEQAGIELPGVLGKVGSTGTAIEAKPPVESEEIIDEA